jgi:hypothetical protein
MNAKTCKLLRKTAMASSLPGEPIRQLVGFAQLTNGVHKDYHPIGAVNNPRSFRGRYRNLKSGRVIDPRRMERAVGIMQAQAAAKIAHDPKNPLHMSDALRPKPTLKDRAVGAFRRFFRRQH